MNGLVNQRWIPVEEYKPNIGFYIVTGKQKYDWEDKWHYFVDIAYCPGDYIDSFWDTFNDWDEGQETHYGMDAYAQTVERRGKR